jgi:hypothetical protein
MPRLESSPCPKCKGPTERLPGLLGSVFVCPRCDPAEPMKACEGWIKSELRPPKGDAPDES